MIKNKICRTFFLQTTNDFSLTWRKIKSDCLIWKRLVGPAVRIWYFSSRYRQIAIWKCNFLISVIELWPHCSTCQWQIGLLYYIDNLQVNLTWKSVEFKGFKNDFFLCNCETYFIQNTHTPYSIDLMCEMWECRCLAWTFTWMRDSAGGPTDQLLSVTEIEIIHF